MTEGTVIVTRWDVFIQGKEIPAGSRLTVGSDVDVRTAAALCREPGADVPAKVVSVPAPPPEAVTSSLSGVEIVDADESESTAGADVFEDEEPGEQPAEDAPARRGRTKRGK